VACHCTLNTLHNPEALYCCLCALANPVLGWVGSCTAHACAVYGSVQAVAATPGSLDNPADWTSEDEFGGALAALCFDDDEGSVAKIPAVVAALCEVQAFCSARGYPKGLIQGIFVQLHQNDVIAAPGFLAWKDDTGASLKVDGKGTALIQLNKWFEWLMEDEEEEEDENDEDQNEEEEDMSDVIKPDNSKVLH
jgi:hypothetical protein